MTCVANTVRTKPDTVVGKHFILAPHSNYFEIFAFLTTPLFAEYKDLIAGFGPTTEANDSVYFHRIWRPKSNELR